LGEARGFAISPDGQWVLAVAGKTPALVLLPTGAGEARTLDRGDLRDFRWGAWLPDGRSVVFSATGGTGASRIYVQAVPEGKPRAISPERFTLIPGTSAVSPDGKSILARNGGRWLVFPTDGDGQGTVIPEIQPDEAPIQWSADARSLYVHHRTPARKVWLLDLATGKRHLWKQFPTDELQTAFRIRVSPDGTSYAHSARMLLSELYLVSDLR
jgi:Tol biopolymer transport system component